MEHLDAALEGTEVVVIPAGVPRKVHTILFILDTTLMIFTAWSKSFYNYLFTLLTRVKDDPRRPIQCKTHKPHLNST